MLTGIGAVALGYNAAQVADCAGYGCDTTTDGATFAIVAGAYFLGGLILVLPVYGISRLMLGLAELLPESEAPGGGKP